MEKEQLILVSRFCSLHQLELSFMDDIRQYELLPLILIEEEWYMEPAQLPAMERIVRMRQELGINMEGIEAIVYMLEKMEAMNHRIASLQNRLKQYE